MRQLVEDVFVTEGLPAYTFVPPPNFNDILVDIRRVGKPVIIEGQSGTGKTTTVRKVLQQLADPTAKYLTATKASALSEISALLKMPSTGTFVIDDFHRLPESTRKQLADLAKLAAEQGDTNQRGPKFVLIGINEVGSDLIQLVPDVAKRTGVHRITPGSQADIRTLIKAGCEQLTSPSITQTRFMTKAKATIG